MNSDGRDAIEKIVAQQAVANSVSGHPVRRTDETKINWITFFRSNLAAGALLEHAQQFRL